jgi:hypothetical protein
MMLCDLTFLLSMSRTRYKYLRQGISITGLGGPSFDAAICAVQDIHEIFRQGIYDGRLQDLSTTKYREHSALDLSNRYFTPKLEAPYMEHVPFDENVDPKGFLEEACRAGYVHGEDNVVRYYSRRVDEQGKTR